MALRVLLALLWLGCAIAGPAELFTNSFLVRLRRDVDPAEAHSVAERNGFVNLGPVSYPRVSQLLLLMMTR